MIKESTINAVKDLAIEDVIGSYIQLKKGKASCPFHNENTGSFAVSKKGFFKCFGCGVGGDAIHFVQTLKGLDFQGAVEEIAKQFNINVEYDSSYNAEAAKEQRAERLSDQKLMAIAHKYFVAQLDQNQDAKDYLINERGYNQDIIDEWGLGFAPANWRGLTDQFAKMSKLGQAEKLSLIKEKNDNEGRYHDFYFNQIIFPICDVNGQIISFAGRTLDKDFKGPKYKNGSQTKLYNKSATLFGLHKAANNIRKHRFGVLVEGYTDVISLHAAGANNSVGVCSSELTKDQAKILARYSDHWVLMPDNDHNPSDPNKKNTGFSKVEQKLALLIAEGVHVDIYELAPQQDPDDLAKEFFNNEMLATT